MPTNTRSGARSWRCSISASTSERGSAVACPTTTVSPGGSARAGRCVGHLSFWYKSWRAQLASADGDGVAGRADPAGQLERDGDEEERPAAVGPAGAASCLEVEHLAERRPSVGSSRRCSDPTAGSPGTTSTAGLSQHSAAGWAFQIGRAIASSAYRPANVRRPGVGLAGRPVEPAVGIDPARAQAPDVADLGHDALGGQHGPDVVGGDRQGHERVVARIASARQPATSIRTPRPAMPCSAQWSMPSPLGPSVGSCVVHPSSRAPGSARGRARPTGWSPGGGSRRARRPSRGG